MEKLRCYMPLPIFCAIISQKHLTSDRNTQPPRQSHQDSKHQPMLHRRANPHQETSLTHPSKSFSNLLSGSLPGHSESQVPFCVDSLVLFTPLRSNTASKTRAKTGKSKRNAKTNEALLRSRKKRRLSMTRIPNPKERVQLPKATSLFHSNALMTPHGLMWSRTNPTKPWTKERGKVSAKNIKIAPQPNPRASLNTAPKAKKKASGLCWKAHGPRALWCPLSKSKKS